MNRVHVVVGAVKGSTGERFANVLCDVKPFWKKTGLVFSSNKFFFFNEGNQVSFRFETDKRSGKLIQDVRLEKVSYNGCIEKGI